MTAQGHPQSRFARAIATKNVKLAELAALELGGLSLADAYRLTELYADRDPARFERAARRWLSRYIEERKPPVAELALAAVALAELRHGRRGAGHETITRLLRRN
jgi:hypothetical protein